MFPRSGALLILVLAAYVLVDAGDFFAQGLRGWIVLPQLALDVSVQVVFFALVLAVWQKFERYNQTLLALFGSQVLIMLVDIPLSLIATLLPASPGTDLASAAQYGILAWSVLVIGYVLKHALDTWLTLGIVLAGTYTLINLVLFALIFPIKS
ncbi:MAG: hypothetical protein ACRETQ_02935 [Gammaproteobacteria bacterium]